MQNLQILMKREHCPVQHHALHALHALLTAACMLHVTTYPTVFVVGLSTYAPSLPFCCHVDRLGRIVIPRDMFEVAFCPSLQS